MTPPNYKQYLGDSVYAEIDRGMLRLYTDNGDGPDQIIYLDRHVLAALKQYDTRVTEMEEARDEQT